MAVRQAPPRGRADLALLVILVVFWVLLWGNLSVANVLSGLAVSLLVVKVLPMPPLAGRPRLRPLGIIRFFAHFVSDLVGSTVEVARQVLRLGRQPRNALIAVRLRSGSDLTMTLTAIALTLLPGSVIVEVRKAANTLYVHVLGAPDAAAVERARRGVLDVEARLIRAFGADDELALLERPPPPQGEDPQAPAGTSDPRKEGP